MCKENGVREGERRRKVDKCVERKKKVGESRLRKTYTVSYMSFLP